MSQATMDKAVILARGLGTRMQKQDQNAHLNAEQAAAAQTGVKAMIPIGRPFLDYVLHSLAEAGYRQICLVIGPEHHQVQDYYQNKIKTTRISIEFAIQSKPLGTADAVAAVESFAAEDPILVINSDNYYPIEAMRELRNLTGPGLAGFDQEAMLQGNIAADRISKFAVIETNADNDMVRIIEKPDQATLNQLPQPLRLSMNCWRFGPSIFEGCKHISPSPRGEYELPDAVKYTMKKMNERYKVIPCCKPVLDMSYQNDIHSVTEKLSGSEVRL